MPGVEILNSEVIYETDISFVPVIVCVIAGIIMGFVTVGFKRGQFDFSEGVCGALIGALIGILIGLVGTLFTIRRTDTVKYVKYNVTVSDDVNFNEFIEKYEIIEQNGKVYTVKERDE